MRLGSGSGALLGVRTGDCVREFLDGLEETAEGESEDDSESETAKEQLACDDCFDFLHVRVGCVFVFLNVTNGCAVPPRAAISPIYTDRRLRTGTARNGTPTAN